MVLSACLSMSIVQTLTKWESTAPNWKCHAIVLTLKFPQFYDIVILIVAWCLMKPSLSAVNIWMCIAIGDIIKIDM